MSLRFRLLVSIAVALVVSLAVGTTLALLHAARSVRTELVASLDVGRNSVEQEIDDIEHSPDPVGDTVRLVATFDGNRHVLARLSGNQGGSPAVSVPLKGERHVPDWFVWAVAPPLPDISVALPAVAGGGAIVLRGEPRNEAGEAWAALGDSTLELLVFCLVASSTAWVTVGHALRPLARLTDALDHVGIGRVGPRVPARGPPELARLAAAFNRMEDRLTRTTVQNERLHQQLLSLQDEERAELARDLHDVFGPPLFSINVSVTTVDRKLAAGDIAGVGVQLELIREDVERMQREVRAMLARLRPGLPGGELATAVEAVVSFWRARWPDVAFDVDVDGSIDEVDEGSREAVYRVIQEAVSNAVRHSTPSRIDLTVRLDGDGIEVCVLDDGAGAEDGERGTGGLGIGGMAERVGALGGTFSAGPRRGTPGWFVSARLPREATVEVTPEPADL